MGSIPGLGVVGVVWPLTPCCGMARGFGEQVIGQAVCGTDQHGATLS